MNKRNPMNPRKKQKVFERDNFTCRNCGEDGTFKSLEVDHIIPVSKGGTDDLENLQTLCYECNMEKGQDVLMDKQTMEEYKYLNLMFRLVLLCYINHFLLYIP